MADAMSQLPACRVPSVVHDAAAREALRRGVSLARVQRDALITHLRITVARQVSHT